MSESDYPVVGAKLYLLGFLVGLGISIPVYLSNYIYKKLAKSEPRGVDCISSVNAGLIMNNGIMWSTLPKLAENGLSEHIAYYNVLISPTILGIMAGVYTGNKAIRAASPKVAPKFKAIWEKANPLPTEVFDERFGELVFIQEVKGYVPVESLKKAGLEYLIKKEN